MLFDIFVIWILGFDEGFVNILRYCLVEVIFKFINLLVKRLRLYNFNVF